MVLHAATSCLMMLHDASWLQDAHKKHKFSIKHLKLLSRSKLLSTVSFATKLLSFMALHGFMVLSSTAQPPPALVDTASPKVMAQRCSAFEPGLAQPSGSIGIQRGGNHGAIGVESSEKCSPNGEVGKSWDCFVYPKSL